ncbi:MAG: ATPase domain-containing protein [Promethearchaeota archaeon]
MNLNLSKILNKLNQYIDSDIISNQRNSNLEQINVLPSGLTNLDNLMNGGFHSEKLYILFGAYSTGKTQLCHQLCVESSKRFSSCLFIDTENTFRPERIIQIAEAQRLNPKKVLKNILVTKVMSNSMFLLNLQNIENLIKMKKYRVLLIDSLNNYYRVEQSNTEVSYFKAKSNFIKILKYINDLTNKYNLIIVATAQVTPSFVTGTEIGEIPVGIQYMNHFFSEFLYLTLQEESIGKVHIINSLSLPEKKVLFKIKSEGIKDYSP